MKKKLGLGTKEKRYNWELACAFAYPRKTVRETCEVMRNLYMFAKWDTTEHLDDVIYDFDNFSKKKVTKFVIDYFKRNFR